MLVESLENLWCGKWADVGRLVQRVAHLERPHPLHKGLLESIVERRRHDEPFGGNARLAIVDGPCLDRRVDGAIELGAGHHDERVAAAELENRLLDVLAGRPADRAPCAFASRQRHGCHARVADDRGDTLVSHE